LWIPFGTSSQYLQAAPELLAAAAERLADTVAMLP
jgi:hypothetical protein